nr:EOG090X07NR [Ilyocryptus agilis]
MFFARRVISVSFSSPVRQVFFTDGRSAVRPHSRFSPGQANRSLRKVGLTPTELQASPPTGSGSLIRPFLFTMGFTGSAFTLAAIWEYENMRAKALKFRSSALGWAQRNIHGDLRNRMNLWWKTMSEEKKLFYGILAANATVFLAWKVPALQKFMVTYFCASPFSRAVCWPMVLSTFSHYSFLHFGVNMYVLHSFVDGAAHSMGKEQFLAFYASAGVVSSLVAHVVKTASRSPGLSLGASGAIMGVLAYFCSKYPDARLQVAFVPGFTFTADSGLKALLCIDTLGLVMRWKLFDHAAHLGGALFGIFWYHYGQQSIWNRRIALLQHWHDFRSGTRPGE